MILKFSNLILAIVFVLGVGFIECVPAQQESWQRIAPVGQSFTILMPTKTITAFRVIPVSDRDSIPVAVYYSLTEGKRYVVAAFLKTSPNGVPALSSTEQFIAAMEHSLKSDGIEVSLTLDRDISQQGLTGKQYRIKLKGYPRVARFLGTENALYALMVIGAEESDSNVARFLSSFQLGNVNTNPEASGVSGGVVTMVGSTSDKPNSQTTTPTPEVRVDTGPPEPWPLRAGPIRGGVLNGKAIHLAVPDYPAEARVLHESGAIQVRVLIDELGNVISAVALNGPPSLREAAVSAAWKTRFTPTKLMGQPVKVNGVIIYNFVAR